MHANLSSTQRQLADYLTLISERCWSAGWIENLEFVTWRALQSGPQPYGHGWITAHDIEMLRTLSCAAGGWIVFDEAAEETVVAWANWPAIYAQAVKHNPGLLDD